MFGYVIANNEAMSPQEQQRYKSIYCGLCRTLEKRHGAMARMTLTYDMTFLILVLGSLYEPEAEKGCERCLPHPLKKHDYHSSEITTYAADMNLALSYLKLLDDWYDDRNLISLFQSLVFKRRYRKILKLYPRQCGVIQSRMKVLTELEDSKEADPDACARVFGELMAEVFVLHEDRWSQSLRAMAASLGQFIYIMDAVIDLEKDIKKRRFNPLIGFLDSDCGVCHYEEILTMLIGDCTIEFEKLPLVEDVSIMRNILYSGVWAKYELHKAKKAKKADKSGLKEKNANDL